MKKSFSKPNKLISEKSPYLLQHAYNPVDWMPWSEDAFLKATEEDKPIFLSIGYSTCHWCHVMEHESFENDVIARQINEHFVPVKVDREERPDIDNIYMSAVIAMTGQGGWPLTVFLTPDKKPFYGGTYFPPKARWGSPGLQDILTSVHNSWLTQREQIIKSGEALTESLIQKEASYAVQGSLTLDVLDTSFRQFDMNFDDVYGGFGQAPKFPTSHNLSFLLRYVQRTGESKALNMVEHTLQKMANGGMYDHLGGGFHRYSTDREWQVPHFEKMLYDQAILSRTYLEAYQVTQNQFYANVANDILNYVLRDLQHYQNNAATGFYSAEDADSFDPYEFQDNGDESIKQVKKEGAFFLWYREELEQVLGKKDAEIIGYHFGVLKNGNARYDPHNEFTGKNILYVNKEPAVTAKHFNISINDLETVILKSKAKLFEVRSRRPRPHLDDKILVDWNGLMIASLSLGARVLNEPRYARAAESGARFILKNLVSQQGRLLHRYRDGQSDINGSLDDYAFFVYGLLELYETTYQSQYLSKALMLTKDMIRLFWDDKSGGFYFTGFDTPHTLYKKKEIYDGAIPSGNSVAALNLLKLYHITLDDDLKDKAQRLFSAFNQTVRHSPSAYSQLLMAFDFSLGPVKEIVVAGDLNDPVFKQMTDFMDTSFIPKKVLLIRPPDGKVLDSIVAVVPFLKIQALINDRTTAYVCENHKCQRPVHTVEELEALVSGHSGAIDQNL